MFLFQIPVQHFNCYATVALVMKTVPKTWKNGWRGIRNLLFLLCMKRVNFNSLGQEIHWMTFFCNSPIVSLRDWWNWFMAFLAYFLYSQVCSVENDYATDFKAAMKSRNDAVWKCSMRADNKQPKIECFFRFLSYSYKLACYGFYCLGTFIWRTLGLLCCGTHIVESKVRITPSLLKPPQDLIISASLGTLGDR